MVTQSAQVNSEGNDDYIHVEVLGNISLERNLKDDVSLTDVVLKGLNKLDDTVSLDSFDTIVTTSNEESTTALQNAVESLDSDLAVVHSRETGKYDYKLERANVGVILGDATTAQENTHLESPTSDEFSDKVRWHGIPLIEMNLNQFVDPSVYQ